MTSRLESPTTAIADRRDRPGGVGYRQRRERSPQDRGRQRQPGLAARQVGGEHDRHRRAADRDRQGDRQRGPGRSPRQHDQERPTPPPRPRRSSRRSAMPAVPSRPTTRARPVRPGTSTRGAGRGRRARRRHPQDPDQPSRHPRDRPQQLDEQARRGSPAPAAGPGPRGSATAAGSRASSSPGSTRRRGPRSSASGERAASNSPATTRARPVACAITIGSGMAKPPGRSRRLHLGRRPVRPCAADSRSRIPNSRFKIFKFQSNS